MKSCLIFLGFLFSFRLILIFFNFHLFGIDNKVILSFISSSRVIFPFLVELFLVVRIIFPFDTWESEFFCNIFNLLYEHINIIIGNPGVFAIIWWANENSFNVCWSIKAVVELFYKFHSIFALNNNNCSHSRSNVFHHFIEEIFVFVLDDFIDNIWE